jgi:hypothetical protein
MELTEIVVELGKALGFQVATEVAASSSAYVDVVWFDERIQFSSLDIQKPTPQRHPVLPIVGFEIELHTASNAKHVKGSVTNLDNLGASMGIILLGRGNLDDLRKRSSSHKGKSETQLWKLLVQKVSTWVYAESQRRTRIVIMTEEELVEWARNDRVYVDSGALTKPTGIEVDDWENFLAEIRKKNLPASTISVLNEFYDWFRSEDFRHLGAKVKVGRGKKLGAMHFYFAKIPSSVFSVWTDGRLSIDYGGFSGYLDSDRVIEFHQKIKSIEGFRDIPDDYTRYPSMMIAKVLADRPEAMATLKDALGILGNYMRIYNPPFRKRNKNP